MEIDRTPVCAGRLAASRLQKTGERASIPVGKWERGGDSILPDALPQGVANSKPRSKREPRVQESRLDSASLHLIERLKPERLARFSPFETSEARRNLNSFQTTLTPNPEKLCKCYSVMKQDETSF